MPKPPQPSQSWSLQKLAEYTLSGLSEIQRAGRLTAAQTYLIGRALSFANLKLIIKGKWMQWLEEQGIPQKTAWEAIKLYEAVKDESELAELTSTEAKIKYGIYKEYMPEKSGSAGHGSSSGGGGNGLGSGTVPQTDEEKMFLAFRRLKDGSESIHSIKKWVPDLLYSTEIDECLVFCQKVIKAISGARKRVKRPSQPKGVKAHLDYLDTL